MLNQIKGLHHVTSMARDAQQNNQFFTHKLGLRRVKKLRAAGVAGHHRTRSISVQRH